MNNATQLHYSIFLSVSKSASTDTFSKCDKIVLDNISTEKILLNYRSVALSLYSGRIFTLQTLRLLHSHTPKQRVPSILQSESILTHNNMESL